MKLSDALRFVFKGPDYFLSGVLMRITGIVGPMIFLTILLLRYLLDYNENMALRLVTAFLFMPLVFFPYHDRLKSFHKIYWDLLLAFAFPFHFTYMLLHGRFSIYWYLMMFFSGIIYGALAGRIYLPILIYPVASAIGLLLYLNGLSEPFDYWDPVWGGFALGWFAAVMSGVIKLLMEIILYGMKVTVPSRDSGKSPSSEEMDPADIELAQNYDVSRIMNIEHLGKSQSLMVLDICRSSVMANLDEEMAYHLKKRMVSIVEPILESSRSRFVKNTGDGFFATFQNASDTYNAALRIMRSLDERNSKTDNPPIDVRISLHYGKTYVINQDNYDLHGNAVNIVFRLESIQDDMLKQKAEHIPAKNRILCSKDFLDELAVEGSAVKESLYCGDAELKGIKKPVNIYLLSPA